MSERKTHLLVGIMGTNESSSQARKLQIVLSRAFTPHGFAVVTTKVGFGDENGDFRTSVDRLAEKVGRVKNRGIDYVSAIGPSGGGTAAVALLDATPDLTAAVALSSSLNLNAFPPDDPRLRELHELFEIYPVLAEATNTVSSSDIVRARADRILSFTPASGDTLFPPPVTQIPGADNRIVPHNAKDHSEGTRYISRNSQVMGEVVNFLREKEAA